MSSRRMDAEQRLLNILGAELRRLLSPKRQLVRLVIIVILAAAAGLGTLAFVHEFDPANTASMLPTATEVSAGTAAMLLGLNAMSRAAADTSDGTVLSSLLLVPKRSRLLLGRLLAVITLAEIAGMVGVLFVVMYGQLTLGDAGQQHVLLGCILAAAVAIPLTASLGFLLGTALRSGVASMLVALTGLVILPLAIASAQLLLPASLQPLIEVLLHATPGASVSQAVSATEEQSGYLPVALRGTLILIAWNALLGLGAFTRFRNEGLAS